MKHVQTYVETPVSNYITVGGVDLTACDDGFLFEVENSHYECALTHVTIDQARTVLNYLQVHLDRLQSTQGQHQG